MSESDDPLAELYEDAEASREQFSEAQQRLREIKAELRSMVDDLAEQGAVTPDEHDRLNGRIDRGEYGEVREAIQRARDGHSATLAFEDDEKQQFADAFADEFQRLVEHIERIRNQLVQFDPEDREQLVAIIYGQHSGLRKRDIQATFDAIDDVAATSITPKTAARVLSAFNRDLNITDATAVLEAIREEADS